MSRTTLLAANVQTHEAAAVLVHSTESHEKAPVGVPVESLILPAWKRTREGDLRPLVTGRKSPRTKAPAFDPSLVNRSLGGLL